MQSSPGPAPTSNNLSPAAAARWETFAPLPLRQRGTLEILDTAIKVYKQYFWVLLGWSALVAIAGTIPYLLLKIPFVGFFVWPLTLGASVCCITAAVRGQSVKFEQCGNFTKARYGKLLLTGFLAFLLFFVLAIFGGIAFGLLAATSLTALSGLSTAIQVIGSILLLLIFASLVSAAVVWLSVAFIVVCMEDRVGVFGAFGRAFSLLNGYWTRVCILTSLLGMAVLILTIGLGIAVAAVFGLSDLREIVRGQDPQHLGTFIVVWSLATTVVKIIVAPIFYLTISLFYLDLRVRKEALDIEWGAHLSGEKSTAVAPQTSAYMSSTPVPAYEAMAPAPFTPPGNMPVNTTPYPFDPRTGPTPSGAPLYSPPSQPQSATQASPIETILSPQPNIPVTPTGTAGTESIQAIGTTSVEADTIGASAAASVICAACGASSPASQAFCMNCGARLQASVPPAAPGHQSKW